MPNVILTRAANDAIRAASDPRNDFDDSAATRQPDGTYRVPLQDETFERLVAAQLAGETLSDTIVRIAATAGRRTN